MSCHSLAVRPTSLLVGQDILGRWLVQDGEGLIEGVFRSRDTALGFARSEGDIYHVAVEMAAGTLTSHLGA